ncbi:hypothetical protein EVA_11858 [gut metagenome]|uniref:Uncharacterized protein n=1 Tax=gut metagenome TaxID=749906 RepID=J9FYK8_9ZZZZ
MRESIVVYLLPPLGIATCHHEATQKYNDIFFYIHRVI